MANSILSGLLAGLSGGLTTYGTRKREDELDALQRQRQIEDLDREILQQREGVMRELQARGAVFGDTGPEGYERIDFAGLNKPAFVPKDFTDAGRRRAIATGLTGLTPVGARSPLTAQQASLMSYEPNLAELFVPRSYSPLTAINAAGANQRNREGLADNIVEAANGDMAQASALNTNNGAGLSSWELTAAVTRYRNRRGRGGGVGLNMTGDSTAVLRPRAATGATTTRKPTIRAPQ